MPELLQLVQYVIYAEIKSLQAIWWSFVMLVADTSPTYKILEEGSITQTKEEMMMFAARQEKFIRGLEAALLRIENKTYGIDRITGELIPKERLRIVPHATLSVESKNARKK